MENRKLGRTEGNVGVIGLGMKYLATVSEDTVRIVVNTVLDNGVNYIDL